jgi:hypothetical protein
MSTYFFWIFLKLWNLNFLEIQIKGSSEPMCQNVLWVPCNYWKEASCILLPGLDQTWWLTWCTKWTLDLIEFEETFGAAKLLRDVYLVMDISHTSSNEFFLHTLRWVRLGLLQVSWELIYRDHIRGIAGESRKEGQMSLLTWYKLYLKTMTW